MMNGNKLLKKKKIGLLIIESENLKSGCFVFILRKQYVRTDMKLHRYGIILQ